MTTGSRNELFMYNGTNQGATIAGIANAIQIQVCAEKS
jgi:hypothetical protein